MDFPNTTSLSNDSTTYMCMAYPWLEPPFDEHTFFVIETVIEIASTGIISLFGVATNIINMIVFFRIGILSDSNTVSLTGLAISDFVCSLFGYWGVTLSIIKYFISLDLNWDVQAFYIMSFDRPRYIFTQITCWLTAYISLERFVAIVFPFKVKRIFTAKHTLFAICCIYITAFIVDYPQYTLYIPKWITDPTNNRSILTYVPSGIAINHDVEFAFNNIYFTLRILSFAIVITCNVTMLRKLALRKFKKLSASPGTRASVIATDNITTITNDNITNDLAISTSTTTTTTAQREGNVKPNRDNNTRKSKRHKDTKIITMMSMVCTLFIVCYTPDVMSTIVFYLFFIPVHWMYVDIIATFGILFESINSSCNIFIYFTMSSRYRQQFKSWIGPRNA